MLRFPDLMNIRNLGIFYIPLRSWLGLDISTKKIVTGNQFALYDYVSEIGSENSDSRHPPLVGGQTMHTWEGVCWARRNHAVVE